MGKYTLRKLLAGKRWGVATILMAILLLSCSETPVEPIQDSVAISTLYFPAFLQRQNLDDPEIFGLMAGVLGINMTDHPLTNVTLHYYGYKRITDDSLEVLWNNEGYFTATGNDVKWFWEIDYPVADTLYPYVEYLGRVNSDTLSTADTSPYTITLIMEVRVGGNVTLSRVIENMEINADQTPTQ